MKIPYRYEQQSLEVGNRVWVLLHINIRGTVKEIKPCPFPEPLRVVVILDEEAEMVVGEEFTLWTNKVCVGLERLEPMWTEAEHD